MVFSLFKGLGQICCSNCCYVRIFGNPETNFQFSDQYTLVASTVYAIAIEHTGDGSNYVSVEVDNSSPSHSGTCYTYISSWSSQAYDACFYLNRDGLVRINATALSDPGTFSITGSPKGITGPRTNCSNLTITGGCNRH